MKQSSTMRDAFCNMPINQAQQKTHGSIISAAIHSANTGAGIKEVKPWNAHLKLRTYTKLKEAEVMV